jgi:hypothetical protein
MYAECSLLVLNALDWRLASHLTQRSHHCVCNTVIRGHVLTSQASHLHKECVLVVSVDGESTLHGVCVVWVFTI